MLRIDRAFVILSLLAASAYADPPPTDQLVVDIAANGTGCPAATGGVSVTMDPDNTKFTVTYAPFLAQVGVGAKSVDFRKTCTLGVFVHAPPGFTYGIAAADYAGFASLARGASGVLRTTYSVQGQSPTAMVMHSISGPFLDTWQAADVFEPAAVLFAPCGVQRNLNILADLRANLGTSDPATTTSFFELDPPVTYHLAWKRCPSPGEPATGG